MMGMGRYFEQTENRSELQQRIAADLRAKAMHKSKQEGEPAPGVSGELVDNSEYLKGTKVTTTLAPAWVFIVLMAVGVFVLFVYQVNK